MRTIHFTNPCISIAGKNDIDEIVSLVNSAYRGESSKEGWTTEAALLDGLRTNHASLEKQFTQPGACLLKYQNEEKRIIGCVYLQKKANSLYLGMLTVSPILQNRGTGKQLLAAAEQYAKQAGCNEITMTVISVRHELIAWYERHGYTRTGYIQDFPKEKEFGIPKQKLFFIVLEKILNSYISSG